MPRLEFALPMGELLRLAVIAKTDDIGAGMVHAPNVREALSRLSGHDVGPVLGHTAYLAQDLDGDGLIDHMLIHLPSGFNGAAIRGLESLRRLWCGQLGEWSARVEAIGRVDDFRGDPYLGSSRGWRSVTPYLHPWYRKARFGLEEQLRRECSLRDWGEPVFERLETILVGQRPLRPDAFQVIRAKQGVRQPDRRGSFWRLTFSEPIAGPVTLGFGRFWGMGLFQRCGREGDHGQ